MWVEEEKTAQVRVAVAVILMYHVGGHATTSTSRRMCSFSSHHVNISNNRNISPYIDGAAPGIVLSMDDCNNTYFGIFRNNEPIAKAMTGKTYRYTMGLNE